MKKLQTKTKLDAGDLIEKLNIDYEVKKENSKKDVKAITCQLSKTTTPMTATASQPATVSRTVLQITEDDGMSDQLAGSYRTRDLINEPGRNRYVNFKRLTQRVGSHDATAKGA